MGTINGLSKRETMLSTPGEIFDLFELYLKANRPEREQEDE